MGTATVITSNALTDLEDDVTELTAKLNGVITEYNKVQADMTINKNAIDDIKLKITNHKGKIDTLITDMTAVNTKITGSYSPSNTPGGTVAENGLAADPILLRLERLDEDYVDLEDFVIDAHSGRSNSRGGNSSTDTTPMNSLSTLTIGAAGSADESTAATNDVSGLADEHDIITPSYSTGVTKVITIGAKGEVRGKRLARQTLNRLRK